MQILKRLVMFYIDGFRKMTVGRTLWVIIFFKLIIMFAVLRIFFFPDFLKSSYSTNEERKNNVIEQLTLPINKSND